MLKKKNYALLKQKRKSKYFYNFMNNYHNFSNLISPKEKKSKKDIIFYISDEDNQDFENIYTEEDNYESNSSINFNQYSRPKRKIKQPKRYQLDQTFCSPKKKKKNIKESDLEDLETDTSNNKKMKKSKYIYI